MKEFTFDDLVRTIDCIEERMQRNKEALIELDSVMGDGDLGITMSKGFTAAKEAMHAQHQIDLSSAFKKVGLTISKAAPSTMGTLIAYAFLAVAEKFPNRISLSAQEFRIFFTVMADKIALRGKAKEGDKTVLDVLYPVGRAVGESHCEDIAELMEIASKAGFQALESTRNMMSKHGKASVFNEKTIGLLDPGSAAVYLMILGFADACGVKNTADMSLTV